MPAFGDKSHVGIAPNHNVLTPPLEVWRILDELIWLGWSWMERWENAQVRDSCDLGCQRTRLYAAERRPLCVHVLRKRVPHTAGPDIMSRGCFQRQIQQSVSRKLCSLSSTSFLQDNQAAKPREGYNCKINICRSILC